MTSDEKHVFEAVVQVVMQTLKHDGKDVPAISPETELLKDLGIDSMNVMELAVELEEALGLAHFDMQGWLDQKSIDHGGHTVGNLARACLAALGGTDH